MKSVYIGDTSLRDFPRTPVFAKPAQSMFRARFSTKSTKKYF